MTQAQAVLCLLRGGPRTTGEFIRSIYRVAAEYRKVISLLRRKGYVIEAVRVRRGEWLYRLVSEPVSSQTQANGQIVFA